MSKLKETLKHKLIDLNMTQKELADKIGVHRQVVANWVSGVRSPKMENLSKIAEILKVSLYELIDDKYDKNNIPSYQFNAQEKIKELEEKLKFKEEQISFLKEKIKTLEKRIKEK